VAGDVGEERLSERGNQPRHLQLVRATDLAEQHDQLGLFVAPE
jgi:hypothetical protein